MPYIIKDDIKYPENTGYSKYPLGVTTQSIINERFKPEMIQSNKKWKSVLQIMSFTYLLVWIVAINSDWITNYFLNPSTV